MGGKLRGSHEGGSFSLLREWKRYSTIGFGRWATCGGFLGIRKKGGVLPVVTGEVPGSGQTCLYPASKGGAGDGRGRNLEGMAGKKKEPTWAKTRNGEGRRSQGYVKATISERGLSKGRSSFPKKKGKSRIVPGGPNYTPSLGGRKTGKTFWGGGVSQERL